MSCGLRETSRVDYTEREERLRERKGKCFPITSPPPAHHRERRNFFLIIIIIIFRRGVFTNFLKQNYTERRKTERKKEFKLTLDHRAHHREKKFFFRERKIKRFLNFIFEVCHNEVFFERPTFFISFSSFEQQWTERNL